MKPLSVAPIAWEDLHPQSDPEVLGRGITSTVYAMRWSGRDVAVKVVDLESQRKRKVEWLQREANLLSQTAHPNLVTCFGGGLVEERAWLVMERAGMNGWQLLAGTALPDHPFPCPAWARMCLDVARGMAYLAAGGIVHRDLTVDNLLAFANPQGAPTPWTLKVSDLGLAKHVHSPVNVIRGSLRHYAPEAIEKKHRDYYTPCADVYMFGLLLYEIAHRRKVWQALPTDEAVTRTLAGERPPIEECCRADYRRLMEACWAHDPSQRPDFAVVVERLGCVCDAGS